MLQGWLDIEAALALAEAEVGLIPVEAATKIASIAKVKLLDMAAIERHVAETGHYLVAMIRELNRLAGPLGEYVHWGATTQDITDTCDVLRLKVVYEIVERDLRALIAALADLAQAHRDTLIAGRTHTQHAVPMTFGFKVSVWLSECLRHLERLGQSAPRVLVGQLSGAVGTATGLGPRWREVQRRALGQLGLGVPDVAWHSARDRIAEFATLASTIGATLGKIALQIATLQSTEIRELEEPTPAGRIGSSTMPHKRNPELCEGVVTAAKLMREGASTVTDAMLQLHERDGVAWLAERVRAQEIACLLCGSFATLLDVVRGLHVDAPRMRSNLELLGGMIASENVMFALAAALGRQTSHELIFRLSMSAAVEGRSFRAALLSDATILQTLGAETIERLLEPDSNVGASREIVDEVVAAARCALATGEKRDRGR